LHLEWKVGSPVPFLLGYRCQTNTASLGPSPRTVLGWSDLLVPVLFSTATYDTQGFEVFSPVQTDDKVPRPTLRYFVEGCKDHPDNS